MPNAGREESKTDERVKIKSARVKYLHLVARVYWQGVGTRGWGGACLTLFKYNYKKAHQLELHKLLQRLITQFIFSKYVTINNYSQKWR